MPIIQEKKSTYADYMALPEGAPYQLIAGELVMSPAPTPLHQIISGNLFMMLRSYLIPRKIGIVLTAPIDVRLTDTEIYQPDIVVITAEHRAKIGEQYIEGAPDLVAEILSPSTAQYDLKQKMYGYQQGGVKEYWVIDPQSLSVSIYQNAGERFVEIASATASGKVASALLSDLVIEIAELFEIGIE